MARTALLIGIQEYGSGVGPLAAPPSDVVAVEGVLRHPRVGYFQSVHILTDAIADGKDTHCGVGRHTDGQPVQDISESPPLQPSTIAETIQSWCRSHEPDDLAVLFISGQGFQIATGELYLATNHTYCDRAEWVDASAISFYRLAQWLGQSRASQQVVVLDCCFHGSLEHPVEDSVAVGSGNSAHRTSQNMPPGIPEDLNKRLVANHRVVMMPSIPTCYFPEQKRDRLSLYTHYWVEGLMTGAADNGDKQWVSAADLHRYIYQQMQVAVPNIVPILLDPGEIAGSIRLSKALIPAAQHQYRRMVQQYGQQANISPVGRRILDIRRHQWSLSADCADVIEQQVLQPYRYYLSSLSHYHDVMADVVAGRVVDEQIAERLNEQRQRLGLRVADVTAINGELTYLQRLRHIQQYRDALLDAIAPSSGALPSHPQFTAQEDIHGQINQSVQAELTCLQGLLALTDEDVALVEAEILAAQ
ncbi:MAG: hypothetical protein F6K16_39025, partial [Symploca sp. SIO2B6]|nr:hypothetical protein [Symploca sp. SIO2B6]